MKIAIVVVLSVVVVVCGRPQSGGYKQPDGYFQYVNVPAHKEYEFGWNRGNPHHYISRFEQAKDHRFRTRVKWSDSYDGYGEHYWEYNHAPKYKHHPDPYKAPEPSYSPPKHQGYASENVNIMVKPLVEPNQEIQVEEDVVYIPAREYLEAR